MIIKLTHRKKQMISQEQLLKLLHLVNTKIKVLLKIKTPMEKVNNTYYSIFYFRLNKKNYFLLILLRLLNWKFCLLKYWSNKIDRIKPPKWILWIWNKHRNFKINLLFQTVNFKASRQNWFKLSTYLFKIQQFLILCKRKWDL